MQYRHKSDLEQKAIGNSIDIDKRKFIIYGGVVTTSILLPSLLSATPQSLNKPIKPNQVIESDFGTTLAVIVLGVAIATVLENNPASRRFINNHTATLEEAIGRDLGAKGPGMWHDDF